MTNKDDIVIPRAELPKTWVEIGIDGTYACTYGQLDSRWRISEASAREARRQAMTYLGIAELLDEHVAERAKAEDEKKLRDEAGKLFEASRERMNKDGITCPAWEKLDAKNIAHWEHIARAARELHGK